jgi:hypothetical protein
MDSLNSISIRSFAGRSGRCCRIKASNVWRCSLGFMDGSLTIAVAVRPSSLVYRWPRRYDLRRSCAKCPRHVVGLAGMVVGGIVDGCGILAATVGGSSLKSCVAHRWPHRDYLRPPAAGIVGPSLGHAATVVGGIVGGCGILAAIFVEACGKRRWPTSNEC